MIQVLLRASVLTFFLALLGKLNVVVPCSRLDGFGI